MRSETWELERTSCVYTNTGFFVHTAWSFQSFKTKSLNSVNNLKLRLLETKMQVPTFSFWFYFFCHFMSFADMFLITWLFPAWVSATSGECSMDIELQALLTLVSVLTANPITVFEQFVTKQLHSIHKWLCDVCFRYVNMDKDGF